MRVWLAGAAAFVALLGWGSAAVATPVPADRLAPMKAFVATDDRPGCAPHCAAWLALEGRIVPGSRVVFDHALRALGGRRLPVFVDSPGGAVDDAMAMGRQIRARHLDVVVTRTEAAPCGGAACRDPKGAGRPAHARAIGSVCASACVLLLAAGGRREAAPWVAVGVHQIITQKTLVRTERLFRVRSRIESGVKVEISRTLIRERPVSTTHTLEKPSAGTVQSVSDYFAAMGMKPELMPLMLATPSTSIHWMTEAEERSTALVTERVDGDYVMRQAEQGSAGPAAVSIPEPAALLFAGKDKAAPQVFAGRVTWAFVPDSVGGGALDATVDIPDAGMTASLKISRPASASPVVAPVVLLRLDRDPASLVHTVERAAMPAARSVTPAERVPLVGTVLPGSPDGYEFHLSQEPGRAVANLVALASHAWLDLPLMLNGTPAVMTLSHEAAGADLLRQALQAWAAASPPP